MKLFKQAFAVLFMAAALVQPALAEMRIGVVDSEMAIMESDAAKRYAKESETAFAPRIKNLNALQADIRQLEEKLQKDGPVLSQPQIETRQLEIQRKIQDLQLQDRQLRQDKATADQTELEKLRPRLREAMDKVAKDHNFDLIVERQVVHFVKSEFDVTRKVIEALNKMK